MAGHGHEHRRECDGRRGHDLPSSMAVGTTRAQEQEAAQVPVPYGGSYWRDTLVLTQEGHVWSWDSHGLLAILQISKPVCVRGLDKVRVIAVGEIHNLALTEDGILRGSNEYVQPGTADTQPKSHPIHVKGLSDRSLYGRGDHGRLGYGRKVTTCNPWKCPSTCRRPRPAATPTAMAGEVRGLWQPTHPGFAE